RPGFWGTVAIAAKEPGKGPEFDARARLGEVLAAAGDRLTLSTALGYIDAKYKKFVTNIGGVPTDVAAFRRVQNTPKWTASGTLAYSTPVGDGDISFGTTLSYRSKTNQFEIPNPYIDQKGFALWDASLVYTAPEGRWSLGVFGKNLTDKQYKTSGYTFINVNPITGVPVIGGNGLPTSALGTEGTLTAFYGNPRQVFVTGTVKF
ncbi:MAG: TonB-dependent receptor, partial [Sphingopyxis sp.]|nr:TonB-dependent receptor [Sphingopyxis sp.]